MKENTTVNYKVKIEGLDVYLEKIEKLKELVNELNDLPLNVSLEEDEIKNIADCAEKIKSQD